MQTWLRCRSAALTVLATVLLSAPATRAGTVVEFQTTFGDVRMELLDDIAPGHVANFLAYVNDGDYDQSLVHRSFAPFLIQGGFLRVLSGSLAVVPTDPEIENEFTGTSNLRGTVSMARRGGEEDSASSQWFVNRADNIGLDTMDGGFTVFANVIGYGMEVVDVIGLQAVWDFIDFFNPPVPALGELPLVGYPGSGPLQVEHLVLVTSARVVPGPGTPPALFLAAEDTGSGAAQLIRYDVASEAMGVGPSVAAAQPEALVLDASQNLYALIGGALTRNGLPAAVPGCGAPEALGLHPDGARLVVGCREGSGARTAHLWNPATASATPLLEVTPNDDPFADIAIDAAGQVWSILRGVAAFGGADVVFVDTTALAGQFFANAHSLATDADGDVWVGGSGVQLSGAVQIDPSSFESRTAFTAPVEGDVAIGIDASGAPVIAVTTGAGAASETRLYFRDQPTRTLAGLRVRAVAVAPAGCEGGDADGDGVGACDNCAGSANGPFAPDRGGHSQGDVDADGFGGVCDGDFNQDGFVGGPDFDVFLQCFNQATGGAGPADDPSCSESDMNGDAFVGGPDFDLFLQGFNQPPGPTGSGCGLGFEAGIALGALRWLRTRRRRG